MTATAVSAPTSPLDVLQRTRQMVTKRWLKGYATRALLSMNGPFCAEAAILFTRANGQRMAQFEDAYPSHRDMLAALDKAISLAETEKAAAA